MYRIVGNYKFNKTANLINVAFQEAIMYPTYKIYYAVSNSQVNQTKKKYLDEIPSNCDIIGYKDVKNLKEPFKVFIDEIDIFLAQELNVVGYSATLGESIV